MSRTRNHINSPKLKKPASSEYRSVLASHIYKSFSEPINVSDYAKILNKYGTILGPVLWELELHSFPQIEKHLNPQLSKLKNPHTILNFKKSIQFLYDSILQKKNILIYSDYDMDGTSALVVFKTFFSLIGYEHIHYFQPNRFDEGYGLNPSNLEKLKKEYNSDILITLDNGSTAFEEVQFAQNKLGMNAIIIDHHQCSDPLPPTEYHINPNQKEDSSQMGYLSGGGLAFFFIAALKSHLDRHNYFKDNNIEAPEIKHLIALSSLGTIGDLVPLKEDNRILVKYTLDHLKDCPHVSIKELVYQCIGEKDKYTCKDIAWKIIPKLNAASRMGKTELMSAQLCSQSAQEAKDLTQTLITLNDERRKVQDLIWKDIKKNHLKEEDSLNICFAKDWHEGVLGILASKLVNETQKPSIVLTQSHNGILRGSMRCPEEHHCIEILNHAKNLIEKFGGHPAAAGLSLKEENFSKFYTTLQKAVTKLKPTTPKVSPKTFFNFKADNITTSDIKTLQKLEPFGKGHEEPFFICPTNIFFDKKILKEKHLKLIHHNFTAMVFNKARAFEEQLKNNNDSLFFIGTLEINSFMGRESVQFLINDLVELNA